MQTHPTDWTDPTWRHDAQVRIREELAAVGRPPTGATHIVKSWGRACVRTVPTELGTVWVKHSYGLPPGEEVVLRELAPRWPGRVPRVVATWPGAVAMEPISGEELAEDDPIDHWLGAARAIGEIVASESVYADRWLALGVRDRRPAQWERTVLALRESPVVRGMDDDVLRHFDAFLETWVSRYVDGFAGPATLVHQDSGCCNIHVGPEGPVLFDWADVVVGSPVFSCDRLLDQVPRDRRDRVIDAFLEPLDLSRDAFDAMRRSNVLHEVIRYHDELSYLSPRSEVRKQLERSVTSQIRVLVDWEVASQRRR